MYKEEFLLVITNYQTLLESGVYNDKSNRVREGIVLTPFEKYDILTDSTVFCLTLGWEWALNEANISYEKRLIKHEIFDILDDSES